MSPDLRQHFTWQPLQANATLAAEFRSWVDQEPGASIRCAVPSTGHGWVWALVRMFVDLTNADATFFSTDRNAAGEAAWARSVLPPSTDELIVLWEEHLLLMSVADAVACVADNRRQLLVLAPDLSRGLAWLATSMSTVFPFNSTFAGSRTSRGSPPTWCTKPIS